MKEAENQATEILYKLDINNEVVQQLALAMLYLGEGSKNKSGTSMGSSDPLILRFFISSLIIQGVSIDKIKCALHLRADQDPKKLTKY